MRKILNRVEGFTLVELLVVISLLGVIALIVVAAINPIEQANRARDTRFNSDSAQLVSAEERYFTSRGQFAWVGVTGGPATNDLALPFTKAGSILIGICGTNCTLDGTLVTNNELKQEFRNRDFVKVAATNTDPTKDILIGKAAGSSASVYACYIPLSKTVRQKACADGTVYTITGATGTRVAVPPATCANAAATWTTPAWYVCMPS